MTQDEKWKAKYNEVVAFIETNKRNPSVSVRTLVQKSHKKVRVADFCRENMLDYYEMVEALKQEKFGNPPYERKVISI